MVGVIGIWLMAHGSVALCADLAAVTIHVTHPRWEPDDLDQAIDLVQAMGHRWYQVRDIADGVVVIDVLPR